MNMIEIRELNDAELNEVSGGLFAQSCEVISNIYSTAAAALEGLGQGLQAANFSSKAGEAKLCDLK